ncbi:NACHT, LRR and PYD domains-containing protein 14-like [Antedon mediterranea]|uniref:NACHT, LRR and PYD domains-containing protein 14-like n=1 Tax=Antedon mediterranea TaxID=105859 RepID=UPI003AF8AE6D
MTDIDKFDDLKFELSKYYEDEDYKLLTFCLFDILPKGDLTKESTGHTLFNKLDKTSGNGIISPKNVGLLLEITRLTGPKEAELLAIKYLEDNNIKNTDQSRLSSYRKQLFRAVRQAEPGALQKVNDVYKLKKYNLFDAVFHLEINKRLTKDPGKTKKFARCLGKYAQEELGLSSTDSEDDEHKRPSSSKKRKKKENQGSKPHSEQDDEHKRPSSSKKIKKNENQGSKPLSEQEIIENYLRDRQQRLCHTNNERFTPSIMDSQSYLNIEIFTELNLVIEDNQRKNSHPTTLPELLDNIKSTAGCRVLISGEAGIGKTTLLKYLAYSTTISKPMAFEGKIVFLLELRDLEEGKSIYDLIEKQLDKEDFNFKTYLPGDTMLIKRFINNHDNKIVLLLDGLDEVRFRNKSLISLFKKTTLEKSAVLLTSRSENIDEFIRMCDIHVKVEGFNQDSIEKYIDNYFQIFNKPKLGNDLQQEIKETKNILAYELCKKPMLLLSICIIYEDKEQSLPSNLADLFKELFRCILNHYCVKYNTGDKPFLKFEDIPEKYVNAMTFLGKCMYKSLKKNQFSINKKDLEANEDKSLVNLAIKLGFVDEQASGSRSDSKIEVYMPTHILIQEALAGFYLYKLCEREGTNESTAITGQFLTGANMHAVGFFGADAGKFLKHWLSNNLSIYRTFINVYFKCVKNQHRDTVTSALKTHMVSKNLDQHNDISKSLKMLIKYNNSNSVEGEHFIDLLWQVHSLILNGFDFSTFCKTLSPDGKGNILAHIVYLLAIHLDLGNCNLSGEEMNDMIRELKKIGGTMALLSFNISNNNLRNIDASLLHWLMMISVVYLSFEMNECNLSGKVIHDINECNEGAIPNLVVLSINDNDLGDIDGTSLGTFLNTFPKLVVLSMINCNISGDVMNEIMRVYGKAELALQVLYIAGNCFGDINGTLLGTFLSKCPKLLKLDMNSCNISGDVMNEMMKVYGVNELTLQELSIRGNCISDIDGTLLGNFLSKCPKLLKLYMNSCNISGDVMNKIMRVYGVNELTLQELFIRGNCISDIDGTLLGTFLSKCPKLLELDMNSCNISGDVMNEMMKVYGKAELALQELSILGNCISDIDGTLLGTFLSKCPKLIKLDMDSCNISGDVMNEMMKLYGVNELTLQELSIWGNCISDIDGTLLGTFLSRCPKLLKLYMNSCNISGVVMNEMMRVYGVNELALQELSIWGNCISDIDGTLLGTFLSKCPKLLKLGMNSCNISGDVMKEMMKVYGVNELTLQELFIRGNCIGDIDGTLLGTFLSKCPKLLKLYMRSCNISGEVMNEMMKLYGVNELALQELSISGNCISDIDGTLLGTFLSKCPKLLKLDMNSCNISGDVMNEMMKLYGVNELTLQELSIRGNCISDIDGTLLGTFLSKCPKLLKLYMSSCNISGDVMNEIMRVYGKAELALQVLYIAGNCFGDINGNLLGTFLSKCPKLLKLSMTSCNISGDVMNEMMKVYGVNELTLQELSICGNCISDIDGTILGTFLSKCPKRLKLE